MSDGQHFEIAGADNQGPDDKKGNTMNLHFRVRNVMLTQSQTQLTLDPVEWIVPIKTDDEGNETEWRDATGPDEDNAEPFEPGGKTTELRLDGIHDDFRPDDFLTITVEPTVHNWDPVP